MGEAVSPQVTFNSSNVNPHNSQGLLVQVKQEPVDPSADDYPFRHGDKLTRNETQRNEIVPEVKLERDETEKGQARCRPVQGSSNKSGHRVAQVTQGESAAENETISSAEYFFSGQLLEFQRF